MADLFKRHPDPWTQIKEFIKSDESKPYVIRKVGTSYVIYPKGENLKAKTIKI